MSSEEGAIERRSIDPRRRPENPFQTSLERLAATESDLGFIYAALELLASEFSLSDAAIVLETGSGETQIFRLNGKAVDTDFAARFGDIPGLYTKPNSIPDRDRDAFTHACRLALLHRQSRPLSTKSSSPEGPAREDSLDTSVTESPAPDPWEGVRDGDAAPGEKVERDHTVWVSQVLIAVDLVNLALTLAGAHDGFRFVFGLIFGLLVPGWSVVGFLHLRNAALQLALSMGSSLAILLVAAQLMTQINLWHLGAFEDFVCVVCLVPLVQLSGLRTSLSRAR